MTLREGAAGTGFEATLERERTPLVGELDKNIDLPWTSVRGVRALAGIVCLKAKSRVAGYASVAWFGLPSTFAAAPLPVDTLRLVVT